jgi:acyl carrier protein
MHPLRSRAASPAQVAQVLETFIRERFDVSAHDAYFSENTNLWSEGYVDSLGMVEILEYLEAAFRVSMPQDLLQNPARARVASLARTTFELADRPSGQDELDHWRSRMAS